MMMRTHIKLFRDLESATFFEFEYIRKHAGNEEAQGRP